MRKRLYAYFTLFALSLFSACDDGGGEPHNVNNANNANNLGCTLGDQASRTFDATGGTLTLCGASVTVDPGALTTPLDISLRVVAVPTEVPVPFEAVGPAFELTPGDAVPHVAPEALSLLVPHTPTTRHLFFFRHTATFGWQEVEACTANDTVIGQRLSVGGTYVALADTVDFPAGVDDLGSGTMVSHFEGEDRTWDLDAGFIDTYAIYNEGPDGGRGVTLSAVVEDGGGGLQVLNLKLGVSAEGEGGVLQVNYGDAGNPDGFWSYLPFEDTATFTVTGHEGETLRGTVTAPLTRGGATGTLTVEIDVSMELYRYAAELVCQE